MLRFWLIFIRLFLFEIVWSVWLTILEEIVWLAVVLLRKVTFLIIRLAILIILEIIITFFLKEILFQRFLIYLKLISIIFELFLIPEFLFDSVGILLI